MKRYNKLRFEWALQMFALFLSSQSMGTGLNKAFQIVLKAKELAQCCVQSSFRTESAPDNAKMRYGRAASPLLLGVLAR